MGHSHAQRAPWLVEGETIMKNLNELAAAISAREGKTKNQNIGELKEMLRCLGDVLRELPALEANEIVGKIIKGRKR